MTKFSRKDMGRTQKMATTHIILTITLWTLVDFAASSPLPTSVSNDPYILITNPDVIDNGVTENVTLECVHNRSVASQLDLISRVRILKEGADGNWDPFAEKRDNEQTIQLHASVMATGYIDNGINGTDAYLKVMWPLATSDTFGRYRCDVIGFDQNQDLAMERTSAVMIVDHNTTAQEVLTLLLEEREKFKQELASEHAYFQHELDTLNNTLTGLIERLRPKWPEGTYGLPQTENQCPSGMDWKYGYIQMHTESDSDQNSVSGAPHVNRDTRLTIGGDHFMKLSLCVITESYPGPAWPAGSYCIMRRGGACPSGFNSGYIRIDTEDTNNKDSRGGFYTDNHGSTYVHIFFCCRSDGSSSTPIVLPTDNPFYLFRYQGTCQNVVGMSVTGEYIIIDSENNNNGDSYGNSYHPDGTLYNVRLELCYYS